MNLEGPVNEKNNETNPNDLMRKMDRALQYGSLDDVLNLIDTEDFNVDQEDFEGRTALQLFSFKGDEKAMMECYKGEQN